ncbi:ATP-binding protein [Rosettibacter firmus]|uniref:ATP-binding protein n=1 Tax=Rosettibacter firmus TaxID=3111522 RepID=UPI00336BFBD8
MSNKGTNIEQLIGSSERIGTIGSPSSTSELTLDILGTAVGKKLVGELALFRFSQDGKPHYALGQITEVQLKNIWLEDPTMRSLARQRGQVNPVSGLQDTHLGQMTVSAVFSDIGNGYEPGILGTVPATGTFIYLVSDQILNSLLDRYKKEIFYLGHVYGSTPKLPLWFKHFDTGENGAGEAYHIGIFGKTGSGKSVLAKMILLAYAKYHNMAIFVIDPQGEFSKDARGEIRDEGFSLDLSNVLSSLKKEVIIKSVRNLILDRWDLFSEIFFESPFFERLSIPKGENRRIASEVLAERLQKAHITLQNLYRRESFDCAWEILGDENVQRQFYRSEQSRDRFKMIYQESDRDEFFNNFWKPITELFRKDREGSISVDNLIKQTFDLNKINRPVVIIDLSKEIASGLFWNETIQALVIKRLLDGLTYSAESAYRENRFLNTLVILDEAHRLAPREKIENEKQESVRLSLLDAVRTTRKYGLGWMFISQTLSSLHREIIGQLRIFFFGFGLALGTEFMALKEIVGGDPNALKLYQSFRDPHSAFDIASRQYAFMTIGPVSPLSFAGTPLFLTAFNTPEDFINTNNLRCG